MSRPYAEVIGDPIAHSKSPTIHKFWLETLGIEADYRAVPVRSGELAGYLESRRRDPDWLGCNLTMPHKQTVIASLDRLSSEAQEIGAVNCVARQGSQLIGGNSDMQGFLEPLHPLLTRHHHARTACLFGAGGAARAVAHALASRGFKIAVAARDCGAARELLTDIEGEHYAYSLSYFAEPIDFVLENGAACLLNLIVNATPLGMHDRRPLPLDWSHVPPGSIIYDLVYTPRETPLLIAARRRGHQTIDGLAMLIGQAAVAFKLFFDRSAPRERDAELRELLTR